LKPGLISGSTAGGNFQVMNTSSTTKQFRKTLESEAVGYGVALENSALEGLSKYYELLIAWNARLHLVAPTSPQKFATRHVLESLILLKYLPRAASVADVGTGAGLPVLPCLIVRTDLRAVLIEASKKKAVFLREALASTATSKQASVIAERFENIAAPAVGFVTCRALERFAQMLPQLLEWAPANATLLLFGGKRLSRRIENLGFASEVELMPHSTERFLFVVKKH
jgi:16S rRNA (guanine527-N7)-methyltransferase